MKFKTTVILLLVALLVGGYILFYERKKPTTDEWKEKSKKVFDIKSEDVNKLQLKRDEALITCEKKDGNWEMTSPLKYPADSGEIDSVLSKLEFLKWERILKKGEWEAKKEEFGLTKARAEVDFWVKDKKSSLKIGKEAPLGGNIYLQVDGRNEVFLVPKDLFSAVDKKPDDFRDKSVLPITISDVKSFEIRRTKDKLVCAREGEGWKLKEPISVNADGDRIDEFLRNLRDLKAEDFVADGTINLAEYGLDQPQVELTVYTGPEPVSRKVLFGNKVKDTENVYARREGQETVYEVKAEILKELEKEANEFKDRTVLKFDKDKIESIRLTYPDTTIVCQKKDEAWEIQQPEQLKAKKDKIDDILRTASDLHCKEFVAEKPPSLTEYGLDKPELEAGFTISGGEEKTIFIGKQKEQEGYYARVPDKDDVFLLNNYDVDDLKLKLSDLKEEEKKEEEEEKEE